MTAATVVSDALLCVGALAVLLSCFGVLLVPDAYDKLHYAGPANTVGTVAIAAAIVVRAGLGQAGVKAIVVTLVLLSTNAALTHATARAATIRARRNGAEAGFPAGVDIPTGVGAPTTAIGDGEAEGRPGGDAAAGTRRHAGDAEDARVEDPHANDPHADDTRADDTRAGDAGDDRADDNKEAGPP